MAAMQQKIIYILWDHSHIWGLMALRSLRKLGMEPKLIKAIEIAQGTVLGKFDGLLLVPGGNARQKAAALQAEGLKEVREYVKRGGIYLGFCGGAGLALAFDPSESLGLCPWRRASYTSRLAHMISGHLSCRLEHGARLNLPVWWPGQFEPLPGREVSVLASFVAPCADLWLADLPLHRLPAEARAMLNQTPGLTRIPPLPPGQPLAVQTRYGDGLSILSYAHPETPGSLDANRWLVDLLASSGIEVVGQQSPTDWDTCASGRKEPGFLYDLHQKMKEVMQLGEQAGLLFRRTGWLWGWRHGIAGMACNNVLATLAFLLEYPPEEELYRRWLAKPIQETVTRFVGQAASLFWKIRIQITLGRHDLLEAEQAEVFGHPRLGGGLAEQALTALESLILEASAPR